MRSAVLLVDDDPKQRRALRTLLERFGHPVAEASTIIEAIARASEVAVALVDVDLPDGSGMDLIPRLLDADPDLGIIIVSGTDDLEAGRRASAAGAFGYLVKPWRNTELVVAVDGALQRRRLRIENRERTEELVRYTKELETQRARAEEASQAKSRFVSSMSHELRTPLNAILGFSDLIEQQFGETLDPRARRWLGNIATSGRHLLDLINDVLDLARVEAGRMDLHPQVMPLADLAAPVISFAQVAAADKGIRFAHRAGAGTVFVDTGRVRQILYNLLSNAVKFTPEGGEVTLDMRLDAGALLIEVTDTGIGMSPEQLKRLYGAFERLHEGEIQTPGTGLGLALTRRMVELHAGTIDASSEVGRGTTFRVRIPDAAAGAVDDRRLLLVEDEPGDAKLIAALAPAAGLAIETVSTLGDARRAVARALPAAAVVDLRLPDGRGEDLIREMKADPRTSAVPILVVSVEDDGGAVSLGADGHVTKPIDHLAVSRWLELVATRNRA